MMCRSTPRLCAAAVLTASLAGLSGCSNAGEGAVTGAGLGAVTGLVLGSFSGNAGEGAAVGAITGAVAGGVIGDQNARHSGYRYGYAPRYHHHHYSHHHHHHHHSGVSVHVRSKWAYDRDGRPYRCDW